MTGIPPQAITAAALRLREGHARLGVRLAANDRRALAADVLEAALPHLVQDGWDAARAPATETNEARRDERERCAQLAEQVRAIYPLPALQPTITVSGEPVPVTAGNAVIWPEGMPATGLFADLLRAQP